MAKAWIGTSGWVYPHWRGRFYPVKLAQARWLAYWYLRFHGPEALYGSGYSDQQLRPWAARIREWLAQGLDVYAYFNNDVPDHAPRDAQRLREMLGGPAPVVITPTPTEVEYVQRPWLPER